MTELSWAYGVGSACHHHGSRARARATWPTGIVASSVVQAPQSYTRAYTVVHLDIAHGVHRQNWLNPGLGEQRMYLFVTSNMSLIIRLGHL